MFIEFLNVANLTEEISNGGKEVLSNRLVSKHVFAA